MRPLAPSTEQLYRDTLSRAHGRSFAGLGDIQGHALTNVTGWPESTKATLRLAIIRAYAELGDPETGRRLAASIPKKYQITRKPKIPSLDEAKAFEKAAKKSSPRVRVLTLLDLSLGLRVSSLMGLTREQVQRGVETNRLEFLAKGGHEQELPCKHVHELLKEALELPRAFSVRGATEEQTLAAFNAGAHLQAWEHLGEVLLFPSDPLHERHAFGRAVREVAKRAKLDPKRWSPHKLRHAFASRLDAKGVPLTAIQVALGHAQVTTTQRYVHVEQKALEKYFDL